MKHLKMRWVVERDERGDSIITDDDPKWYVAKTALFLPDDPEGTNTLQYICNLHNTAIAEG